MRSRCTYFSTSVFLYQSLEFYRMCCYGVIFMFFGGDLWCDLYLELWCHLYVCNVFCIADMLLFCFGTFRPSNGIVTAINIRFVFFNNLWNWYKKKCQNRIRISHITTLSLAWRGFPKDCSFKFVIQFNFIILKIFTKTPFPGTNTIILRSFTNKYSAQLCRIGILERFHNMQMSRLQISHASRALQLPVG